MQRRCCGPTSCRPSTSFVPEGLGQPFSVAAEPPSPLAREMLGWAMQAHGRPGRHRRGRGQAQWAPSRVRPSCPSSPAACGSPWCALVRPRAASRLSLPSPGWGPSSAACVVSRSGSTQRSREQLYLRGPRGTTVPPGRSSCVLELALSIRFAVPRPRAFATTTRRSTPTLLSASLYRTRSRKRYGWRLLQLCCRWAK